MTGLAGRVARRATGARVLARLAYAARTVDVLIAWKVEQEQRAEARFHNRRRAVRRRRRARLEAVRGWARTVTTRRGARRRGVSA